MTPVELSRTVLRAVRRAVDGGELSVVVPGRAVVTVPGPGGCGDYATNIALQLARPAGQPPRRVAEILRAHLLGAGGVGDVVVTGPGFLNISLQRAETSASLVREILRSRSRSRSGSPGGVGDGYRHEGGYEYRYGYAERATGELVQLHAPHEVRAVVVMDVVARLLRSQGALVRTSCAARPEREWTEVLGVEVDAYGTPDAPAPLEVNVRPVPAPHDPVPSPHADLVLGRDAGSGASLPHPAPALTPTPVPLMSLGRDAGRWALVWSAVHDRPRVSGEYLVQREGNPLFRVRYAHARTRALSRNAADLGFEAQAGDVPGVRALEVVLADHPRILAAAAAQHAPDRLARHLLAVADAVTPLLPTVLPRGEEKPSAAHRARLALAEAAGTVLAGGLSLLGIDAPDHL
ncbi:arginyl-tRNA synthetase [Streptomyces sp. 3330]|uniref:ArgS-related anticodon-binding protein NrtL n=1 Tax=Streptomyces sp. 3330 TaxID=2817755 RepID=UPI002856E288|nr:DALR anticodon-binding domain-containing protein [Streptomyces sp. 3330]MDR6976867.1 arginyl-tRNA synthetase [Streptomyces sp. 3330]